MAQAFTPKGAATRGRIVAGAAAELRERGVDEVRLEDVLARTGTSKGQLFHYFPGGKEELLLAVAQHEADQVLIDQQPLLGELTSWDAWQAWRERLIARYREQGQRCPLGALLGPAGRRTPAARAVVTGLLGRWEDALADGIRHMQSTGDIAAEVDAGRAAAAMLAGIQGGVLLLLHTGRTEHLAAAVDLALDALRGGARS
ncbi:TetR/AcrR family transcriptional regulator [Micromonospora chersina]|uniref:TetR/AcrR family transcriptional regulator n=1 Tax=Micromonospora chersina TaxID=47854 RepID=UPI0037A83B31